jgi:hypothetical protein
MSDQAYNQESVGREIIEVARMKGETLGGEKSEG